MRGQRSVLAVGLLLLSFVALPSPASAENCLQRFSCQLYGPCRLPCLDAFAEASDPAPAAGAMPQAPREIDGAPQTVEGTPKRPRIARGKAALRQRFPSVSVVGARSITSLAQLAGKPVSFGLEGDVSQALGRRMFARLGLKVEETPLDFANALDGVSTGDVAAVLVLHDRDVAKVKSLQKSNLHLLPVPGTAMPPAGTKAPTLASEAAGPSAHSKRLRAFAPDAVALPQVRRRVASAK